MNDVINLNSSKIVIDTCSKNKKYTHEEKIKYLEDAIKAGGYYDEYGTWNSIKVFSGDNHIYRVRVETLIIKDNNSVFIKFLPKNINHSNKRTYIIPGGSIANDVSNIDQAINECKEEARILVKNIKSTGITYKETLTPPKWVLETRLVNWNANFTEIYVADYDKKYNGYINKVDEDKSMITGKFYNLDKIYPYLKQEHKKALQLIYPNRFKDTIKSKITTEFTCESRKSILDKVLKILTDNGYNPVVSSKDKQAFFDIKKYPVSDSSTICISGFKYNEVKKVSNLVNSALENECVKCSPDNYGTIFLSIGSDIIIEKALTTKERNRLSASQFGIPSLRKFPIHDKAHVIQAIKFFNTVDRKHEKELAYNIIKAMKYFNVDFSIVGEINRLQTYLVE